MQSSAGVAAANKRAEGRKRSPLLGQEAVREKSVRSGVDEGSRTRDRRFNTSLSLSLSLARARARGRVSPLKLMGGVGGYRDVFDVAVAVQTAQLPIRMAAAGAFKAGVALDVCTGYTCERAIYVLLHSRVNLSKGKGRKIYRKAHRRGNAAKSG